MNSCTPTTKSAFPAANGTIRKVGVQRARNAIIAISAKQRVDVQKNVHISNAGFVRTGQSVFICIPNAEYARTMSTDFVLKAQTVTNTTQSH